MECWAGWIVVGVLALATGATIAGCESRYDRSIAGTIASFMIDDRTEVTYWIDRALWGRGIASAALQSFLPMTAERPLFARAASDNAASLRVLEKAGFRRIGVNRDFARGRGEEIEETILRLD
ncbi:MAG TPA: GNAT family protein [Actinomycetota bacterium]